MHGLVQLILFRGRYVSVLIHPTKRLFFVGGGLLGGGVVVCFVVVVFSFLFVLVV